MTVIAATEAPQTPPLIAPVLETWGKNERMRHIPSMEWITKKVDVDLRRRIEIAASAFETLVGSDPRRTAVEHDFTAVCRSLERLAEVARHSRVATPHVGSDVRTRVAESVNFAVAALQSVDGNLVGRRYPFQTLERSKAEPLVGALLVVMNSVNRLLTSLRPVDPGLDERLLDGLITVQEPLRPQAIA